MWIVARNMRVRALRFKHNCTATTSKCSCSLYVVLLKTQFLILHFEPQQRHNRPRVWSYMFCHVRVMWCSMCKLERWRYVRNAKENTAVHQTVQHNSSTAWGARPVACCPSLKRRQHKGESCSDAILSASLESPIGRKIVSNCASCCFFVCPEVASRVVETTPIKGTGRRKEWGERHTPIIYQRYKGRLYEART